MDSVTDAASAVSYVRGVQDSLNVLMTLGITSHLWMPESHVADEAEYDFIVVGAGTSGAIVGSRIAQNRSATVLLLEAGGDPSLETVYPGLELYTKSSQIDYQFTTTSNCISKCGRDGNSIVHAGKVLGGSSSINLMHYQRGVERDYEPWVTASKNPHWSWNNTLKYFKKTEKNIDPLIVNSLKYRKYHGLDGPLTVTRESRTEIDMYRPAYQELVRNTSIDGDLNSYDSLGFAKSQYTISSYRESSATAFLKRSDKTPYLDLLKHTEVTKILFGSNNNAIGVQAVRNNKVVTYKARKEVIISAGAINTPKLLMLSGIGPKKHLECKGIKVIADLPVGENYHDHVSVVVIHNLGKACGKTPELDLHNYPHPSITGYVALNQSSCYPDYVVSGYFLLNQNSAQEALLDTAFYHRYSRCISTRIYQKSKGNKLLYSFIKKAIPKSRGRVTLRSSDCKDQPVIDGGYFRDEKDLEDYVDFLQDYMRIGDTKLFKEIGAEFINPLGEECREHEYGSREYWKCYVRCMSNPSDHGVGTCAMGSVVDGELNVLGVKKLRVVDASIMPVITTGATAAPTMMIAEKGANIIIQDMYR